MCNDIPDRSETIVRSDGVRLKRISKEDITYEEYLKQKKIQEAVRKNSAIITQQRPVSKRRFYLRAARRRIVVLLLIVLNAIARLIKKVSCETVVEILKSLILKLFGF